MYHEYRNNRSIWVIPAFVVCFLAVAWIAVSILDYMKAREEVRIQIEFQSYLRRREPYAAILNDPNVSFAERRSAGLNLQNIDREWNERLRRPDR